MLKTGLETVFEQKFQAGPTEWTLASPAPFSSKKILQYPSHRMFGHMYEILNTVKK